MKKDIPVNFKISSLGIIGINFFGIIFYIGIIGINFFGIIFYIGNIGINFFGIIFYIGNIGIIGIIGNIIIFLQCLK